MGVGRTIAPHQQADCPPDYETARLPNHPPGAPANRPPIADESRGVAEAPPPAIDVCGVNCGRLVVLETDRMGVMGLSLIQGRLLSRYRCSLRLNTFISPSIVERSGWLRYIQR